MRMRILCLMLCLATILPMGSWALAAEDAAVDQAVEGTYFLVDGNVCEDPGITVYNGITYVSLVNAVLALRPEAVIAWEGEYVVVTDEGLDIRVRVGDQYIQANGRCLYVLNGIIAQNGRVLVPVRTIAQAMGGWVSWSQESGVVEVYSGESAIISGESYYNSDSLYWLSRIISAESGNQSLDGKLAVGTVIMNRVESPLFPNTIYDVIFAPNQFSPASNGSINREPNAESVVAAKLILEGVRVGGSSLYFVNPSTTPNSWAERNRTYVTTIGAHAFFS
ncbi:cell wall hydrolase [Intestinimonas butyriciproducens]|uniref:Cell wall hydrolase n=1 Tax=Candidatus Intestinimonas merdavium TaxID=2838622 RepID=A0A9D2CE46_9FIRM|nr:cell wall hydrolase [Intestinimonas butyriciproducens]MBM6976688.1 cell wall hydrolase [Intestinimonas butyriciproducens]HIY73228.1 cell wall hydrolase [Candidatus Intestinimonas merdavium]